jgi:hypothetical protein
MRLARRGFLGFLGLSPTLTKGVAGSLAQSGGVKAPYLHGGPMGHEKLASEDESEMSLQRKSLLQQMWGLEEQSNREGGYRIGGLEANIATLRLPMTTLVRMQRERDEIVRLEMRRVRKALDVLERAERAMNNPVSAIAKTVLG